MSKGKNSGKKDDTRSTPKQKSKNARDAAESEDLKSPPGSRRGQPARIDKSVERQQVTLVVAPERQPSRLGRLLKPTGALIGVAITAAVGATVAAFATPLGALPRIAPLLDNVAGHGHPIDVISSFDASWPAAFDSAANAAAFVRSFNRNQSAARNPRMWGGVPMNTRSAVFLNVTGNLYEQVRITSIRIKFAKRTEPIRTALVVPPGGKGGAGDYEVLSFDLDNPDPVGLYTAADGKVTDIPYFQRRNVSLGKDESIHFLLNLTARKHLVKFTVEIGYEYGAASHLTKETKSIDDGGVPFAFTAPAPARAAGAAIAGPSRNAGRPDYSGYRYVWQSTSDGSRLVAANQAK